MEQYLKDDYNVIEDENYLKSESDIKDYFGDLALDYMDCGQGYYTDEYDWICKIGEKFYEVHVKAEIGSSKQDYGDRLYWVESIESTTYNEIEKPLPKERCYHSYTFNITEENYKLLEEFISKNKLEVHEYARVNLFSEEDILEDEINSSLN